MPSCPLPFRTAPRLGRRCRCDRPALCLPLVLATCTEMCRRSFLLPSSPLSACPPSASSHSPVGSPASPIRNPAALLLPAPARCCPASNHGAPRRRDALCPTRLRSEPHTLVPP